MLGWQDLELLRAILRPPENKAKAEPSYTLQLIFNGTQRSLGSNGMGL